jgi:hypothetical protein
LAAPKPNEVEPTVTFAHDGVDWPDATLEPDANCPFVVNPALPVIPVVALKNRTSAVGPVAGPVVESPSSPQAAANSTAARTGVIRTLFMLLAPVF